MPTTSLARQHMIMFASLIDLSQNGHILGASWARMELRLGDSAECRPKTTHLSKLPTTRPHLQDIQPSEGEYAGGTSIPAWSRAMVYMLLRIRSARGSRLSNLRLHLQDGLTIGSSLQILFDTGTGTSCSLTRAPLPVWMIGDSTPQSVTTLRICILR